MRAKEAPTSRASHPRTIAWQMVTGVAMGSKNRLCRPAYGNLRLRQEHSVFKLSGLGDLRVMRGEGRKGSGLQSSGTQ